MIAGIAGSGIFLYSLTEDKSVVVLAPLLTQAAYSEGGFYDYFEGTCDESCLTVPVDINARFDFRSSSNALIILGNMGYHIEMDSALLFDPNYLDRFDHVILLHEEYVTQEMFDAITNHPSVFYFYPNALYALVEVSNDMNMTLVSGHHYNGKDNAFDWKWENTRPDEFDVYCLDYKWREVSNGWQLNCYPENTIMYDESIIDFIVTKIAE